MHDDFIIGGEKGKWLTAYNISSLANISFEYVKNG